MRLTIVIIAAFVGFAQGSVVLAQPADNTSPEQGATCPPDVKGEPPTVGGGSSGPLSDKLAQSKGVICPPAGIDRDMQVTPPSGGHLKVIPPPGTPGGDQNVRRSNPSAPASARRLGEFVDTRGVSCSTSGKSSVTTASGAAFHAETLLHRPPKRNLGLGLSANSRVRVAVESGLESANRFDLRG